MVELLFGGFEREHEVEHGFVHLLGAAVGLVDLVDDHNGLEAHLDGFLQYETCLRHRPFEGVDQQQHAVGHVEHALHFAAEVGVAWSVDDVYLVFAPVDGDVLGKNGDASFAFELVVVHHQLAYFLIVAE